MTDAHPVPATTIRIGRQPDNDIALRNLEVSRHHAELRRNPDGSFEIIDLGSHGGTFVNGERITRTMLTEQDIISIGHATFRLSGGELRQDPDEGPGRSPAIINAHEVVAAYWAAAEARDWNAFGALLADDVVYRGPRPGSRSAAGTPISGSTWKASLTTGTSPCGESSAKASAQPAGSRSPGQEAASPACASSISPTTARSP
jgi:predicted component of type VI protein secretion system